MNLADAIRQAAQTNGTPLPSEAQPPTIEVIENPAPKPEPKPKVETYMEPAHEETRVPDPPNPAVTQGGVVRLELFLSPEQLSGLFRAVVANQHTVMTLREAAQYLRIPPSVLEQMASEGQVPALLIDGKWRFARTAVDEWLNLQGKQREMEA
ncbi:MAG: hypothetical protein BGO01_18685 [Armatimonadetes bacterium 55-13]|nr:helix-turn-helix domain-containing protein [Armatimonadota bacterium]OJU64156.1 MAG: hypothetical protein BGO01_18685 [Armatimonadetes bacterium 55-13]